MSDRLPAPPQRRPDLADDFRQGVHPDRWITSYLPHWSTPTRSEARYARRPDGLALQIHEDQLDWRTEDAPLRVSNLQTGSYSGPVGSGRGTHRHRPDELTVRTEVPLRLLWAPCTGRVDVRVSASRDLDCMLAAWLIGSEHQSPRDSGEVCIFEIDARQGATGWTARTGVKAHHDDRLVTTMIETPLTFDASSPHTWTAIWGKDETVIGCNGSILHRVPRAPHYPMFLMLDLFEIGAPRGSYPKTALLHSVNAWSTE